MHHAKNGAGFDREALRRPLTRVVWAAYLLTLAVACVVHAGKAAQDRGAFVRWRPQVHELWKGVNIWDKYIYPNPPILPIALSPLMALPPVPGAVAWFLLKSAIACGCIALCLKMARGPDGAPAPAWVLLLVMLLSLRPILSDLHHGNNNLIILGLVVATLAAWRQRLDVLAGIALALAICFKVTPALFLPYFLYKRSWRTVGATMLGIGLFLVIVPGLILGPEFNGRCLGMWFHRILSPFLVKGISSSQEVNQSLAGVLTRLLTETKLADGHGNSGTRVSLNLIALDPQVVDRIVKGLSLVIVGLLGLFCRTRADRRDDPRLLGEFSLVVLTMLFVSERSWKHHYVTILLPIAYLGYRLGSTWVGRWPRRAILGSLALSALLMATTSSDLAGGAYVRKVDSSMLPTEVVDDEPRAGVGEAPELLDGHDIAQYYGMFLWSGVVLYAATAWRVAVERKRPMPTPESRAIPAPHAPVGVVVRA